MGLQVVLSAPRGFCEGVKRAIEIVEQALELWGAPIYVKHEIVHNRHVVNALRDKGAVFIEDLNEVPEGARVIYSAHGISPQVREQAKQRHLIEIDASCPLVIKVHSAVKRYAQKGYQIVLIGHKRHVEIIGTMGEAPEVTQVVETVADVAKLDYPPGTKLFYCTQTTLSLDDVKEISEALTARYPEIESLPTSSICYATTNRQMAIADICADSELILVIGDTMSSNSNRLREVAERRGVRAYLINHPDEIEADWLRGVERVGITAGASTPEHIVQSCVDRLRSFDVASVSESVFTVEDVVFSLPKPILEAMAQNSP
jgi:4-hydroxy-3-methylbut-2-en-1-yl diphosphate reductase